MVTCTEKLAKVERVVPELCIRTDRQTNKQTDRLITTLRHLPGRSNALGHKLLSYIVVKFERFELYYWLELYELYYKNKVHNVGTVSYTHLTLPTNREV